MIRYDRFIANFDYNDNEKNQLGQMLQGEVSCVFITFTRDLKLKFTDLRSGLMKTFQCTTEGFWNKVRNLTPKVGATMQAFGARIRHFLDRWIDLSGISKSVEGLFNLGFRDQFIHHIPHVITSHLQHNLPKFTKGFANMVRKADLCNDHLNPGYKPATFNITLQFR